MLLDDLGIPKIHFLFNFLMMKNFKHENKKEYSGLDSYQFLIHSFSSVMLTPLDYFEEIPVIILTWLTFKAKFGSYHLAWFEAAFFLIIFKEWNIFFALAKGKQKGIFNTNENHVFLMPNLNCMYLNFVSLPSVDVNSLVYLLCHSSCF